MDAQRAEAKEEGCAELKTEKSPIKKKTGKTIEDMPEYPGDIPDIFMGTKKKKKKKIKDVLS